MSVCSLESLPSGHLDAMRNISMGTPALGLASNDDSSYSSSADEDDEDPLDAWLGHLHALQEGLENVPANCKLRSSTKLTIPTPRMDTYRFSMANMEDSQDVELDAILGELCALEDKLDREMLPKSQSANQALGNAWKNSKTANSCAQNPAYCSNTKYQVEPKTTSGHSRSNSGGTRPKFEIGGLQVDMYCEDFLRVQKSELGVRTESPDNDSAFSDNVSMLSSESSASSGGVRGESHSGMSSQSSCMSLASSPTQVEQAARIKAEKIKIALEKMKEASIKKLYIKAFSVDNSAKSLLIDETMTVGNVCELLAEKNHVPMDPKWALVEQIPELYIERVYEDHEHVVENLLLWTRDSCNHLFFLERKEKYDLFLNPQDYLLGGTSSEKNLELDDDAKNILLDEFFSTTNVGVPEVEGLLYLKGDGKKAWKKHFFVLRASGLYYCPKGKSKLSKDLLCLTTFDMNNVYFGFGWKKKYKSPTDFGFAIKHPQIQTKSSKYIKYLCAEDEASLKQWMMGIRIAKYGLQMKENYDNLLRDLAEDDLENLANARSFSISSVVKQERSKHQNSLNDDEPPTTLEHLHKLRVISRQDSIKSSKSNASGSSGCPSERSSTGTPTADHLVFDADFPMGTIKRKPSMTPKIPLTNTTRNLAKQSGEEVFDAGSGPNSCNGSLSGSLGRSTCGRFSLRRSHTDDRISFGSLSRKQCFQETPLLLGEDLPPPPPEISDPSECINFDTLPPPPPEAFRNMESFLPPPPLLEDTSWLNVPAVPPKPRKGVRRRQSESDAREHHRGLVVVKPKPSKHNLNLSCETEPTSPKASDRRSRSQHKPSPPKRSENTKLSSAFTAPQRRSASASAAPYDQEAYPPESFLRNLQKVMVRKWKVAQQLSTDNGPANSHQIFGFRDPNCLPAAEKRLQRSPSSPPPLPTHKDITHGEKSHKVVPKISKKHPPPPPPKNSNKSPL